MYDVFTLQCIIWLGLQLYGVLVIYIMLFLCGDVELNPGPNVNCLNICHINIQRLSETKLLEIKSVLAGKYDIIALCETFLDSNCSFELSLEGYLPVMRRDRSHGIGGGVAAYFADHLVAKRRLDLEQDNVEIMWSEVSSANNKILFSVCYRPPQMQMFFWDELQCMIDQIRGETVRYIVLAGDFNADEHTQAANNSAMQRFSDANNLYLHVNEPTRITKSCASILDQFISNIPDFVKEVSVSNAPLLTNDHLSIYLTLQFKVCKQKAYDRHVWLYEKADWNGFRESISLFDWDSVFVVDDVDVACDRWTSTLLNIARQFIPNRVVTVRPNDAPFYNSELRRMKRQVERRFQIAKRSKLLLHWEKYKQYRNAYVACLKEAKENYSLKLASDMRASKSISPKNWWHIAKQMMGSSRQSQYPALQVDGNHISDPVRKAEAFNAYFVKQTLLDDSNTDLPADFPSFEQASFEDLLITEEEVLDQLKGLKTNKASGPDLISPRMLKEASKDICPSLTRLFNMSIRLGRVPSLWKRANVIPVHKKKERDCVGNYRPVSLLSCAGKLQEKVIFKHLYNFLQFNKLISPVQSGFRPGDSTVNQLIHIYHIISGALDKNKDVRLVFCDISKAFDRVWHKGLLFKLSKIGVKGKLLEWFTDYLSDRQQRVTLQGHTSNWKSIRAGVPQGSVLGPLLFLIYINDIVSNLQCSARLFADDTTLYIDYEDAQVGANALNQDLESVKRWAIQWLVKFNPDKTTSLVCSYKNKPLEPALYFDGCQVISVKSHCHLGLTLSHDLTWNDHIEDMVRRANKRLDIVCRLSYMLDRGTLSQMYSGFVRPLLEYGDILFNNCTEYQAQKIEAVQKRAARIITGAIKGTSTNIMYNELGWTSMKHRRDVHSLCLFHKIINGKAPQYLIDELPKKVGIRTDRNLRNRDDYSQLAARTNTYSKSFFPSTVKLWNALDSRTRSIHNFTHFKNSINPKPSINSLFTLGPRYINIIWSRIRMKCSALKGHLYNMHIINSPKCACGYKTEDEFHFFFQCSLYSRQRNVLINSLNQLNVPIELNTLLNGVNEKSHMENVIILNNVFNYVGETNRFS